MNLLARLTEKDLRAISTDRNVPEVLRITARQKIVLEQIAAYGLPAVAPSSFHFFHFSTFPFLLPPFPRHLGQPFHVDVRFRAQILVGDRLDELDGVGEIVVDRLLRRLEVDLADLGNRGSGIRFAPR